MSKDEPGNQKQEGRGFIPDNKVELKPKGIKCDKGHFIMLKALIHNEYTILMDIYVPKNTSIRMEVFNFKQN